MNDDLVNIHGLAQRLHLSQDWLRAEIKAQRLPFLKIGRRRLFSLSAVRTALARRAAAAPYNDAVPEAENA